MTSLASTVEGTFTAERQLFEDRQGKREQSPTPEISPTGRGSLEVPMTIVGPGIDEFETPLREAIADRDEHDDAPAGAAVDVPIRSEVETQDWYRTLKRLLGRKNIETTPEAVKIAHALVGSPLALAPAVARQLSTEASQREVRADEMRRVLAAVDQERLLPEQTPTVSAIVSALLQADEPLTRQRLDDAADISGQSRRNNWDALTGLGLIRETTDGRVELTLSQSHQDRSGNRWPLAIANDWGLQELAVGIASVVGPPSDAGAEWWRAPPDSIDQLRDEWPWIPDWRDVVCSLVSDFELSSADGPARPPATTVRLGTIEHRQAAVVS